MQAGLRAAGFALLGAMTLGIAVSALWGLVALKLGRRYEVLRLSTLVSPLRKMGETTAPGANS
jgi:hypothetical protein